MQSNPLPRYSHMSSSTSADQLSLHTGSLRSCDMAVITPFRTESSPFWFSCTVMDKKKLVKTVKKTKETPVNFNWSKLEAFADIKINVPEKMKFVSGMGENILGKEENAGNQ